MSRSGGEEGFAFLMGLLLGLLFAFVITVAHVDKVNQRWVDWQECQNHATEEYCDEVFEKPEEDH